MTSIVEDGQETRVSDLLDAEMVNDTVRNIRKVAAVAGKVLMFDYEDTDIWELRNLRSAIEKMSDKANSLREFYDERVRTLHREGKLANLATIRKESVRTKPTETATLSQDEIAARELAKFDLT